MKKTASILILLLAVAGLVFGVTQWFSLREAHSTFDNYYAFRGCVRLIDKTDTSGTCETSSGDIVKIVMYQGMWYLDGDLPWACLGDVCLGI